MATERSASMLLFTLIATIILFFVFVGVSNMKILDKHAYMPGFGWKEPSNDYHPGSTVGDDCFPTTVINGFPVASTRQAEIPDNCLKATNSTASAMNYALYFAVAGIISVGIAERVKDRL